MVLYMAESEGAEGSLPLEEVAAALAGRDIPLVVDAAAELPPIAGLARYLAAADLVVLSGGKELRGPQSSGLVLGDARLIAHCHANSFPRHGIGRGMKTDKETIVGLATAVELFVARDEAVSFAEWEAMVAELVTALSAIDGAESWRGFPADAGIQPATIPRAYLRAAGHPAELLRARLREASVLVGIDGDALAINPQCLRRDEVPLVIRAIRDALG
jgi:L-seryl-tRNA(Ser) seleniumtransferase